MSRLRITSNAETGRWQLATKQDGDTWQDNEYAEYIRSSGSFSDNTYQSGYHIDGYPTRDAALEDWFKLYAYGGYPYGYYFCQEGYFCRDCARDYASENIDDETGAINIEIDREVLDDPRSQGEYCAADHGDYITEPFCADCGTDQKDWIGEGYTSDSEDDIYCAKCMAKYRHNLSCPPRVPIYCGWISSDTVPDDYRDYMTAMRVKPGLYSLTEYSYVKPGSYWSERLPEYSGKWKPQSKGTFYAPSCGGRFTSEDWKDAR